MPCRFLVVAHPGHLCQGKAEEELHGSLGLDPEEHQFQLSSRTVSVPIQDGNTRCFSFQVVVVDSSAKDVSSIREQFYELRHPNQAIAMYPYTGLYQFCSIVKILGMVDRQVLQAGPNLRENYR